MHPASLLVAALVMLRHPCTRSRITASLLLARAAQDTALSPAEREACLNLVDELEHDAPAAPIAQEETTQRHTPRRNAKSFNRAPAF
ncbi:MAG: hypothetical protein KKA22_06945 [Gammaproteobacteria bacterium]|jgi:hypothetical protein|nr:hypothetical protein [Gammaproteobacteria bacterium]MBU1407867.1 hypothetical protein [Gammaproteobacteria bacterium]MBU1531980.1 hypothetical protein [Gammaproteobacteria bacterium]